jgi:arylsulfatase A-like enzyme
MRRFVVLFSLDVLGLRRKSVFILAAVAEKYALPTRAVASGSVFAWILAGLLACGAEPDSGPDASRESAPLAVRRPNIIVYLVDTLRRDHLATYGYSRDTSPRLTAFAADAVRFDNAYTPSSWTRPAVASLLTGLAPARHGVSTRLDRVPQRVRLAGEYLGAAGYWTAAVVTNPNVLPVWGFERGFQRFTDIESEAKAGRADDVNEAVSLYLRERADAAGGTEGASGSAAPFFLYLHTMDPHEPYEPPAPYDELWPETLTPEVASRYASPPPGWVVRALQLYDGEISFNDEQFGRLLERLEEEGLYRDSLIVFTADHGEEFLERSALGHGQTLFEAVVQVPLLIKLPGNAHAGKVVDDPASLVDLLPTVLALLGEPIPDGLDGRNLMTAIESAGDSEPAPPPIFLDLDLVGRSGEPNVSAGVIVGSHKYVENSRPNAQRRLYDLERDPRERSNLAYSSADGDEALRDRLARLLADYRNADEFGIHLWVRSPGGAGLLYARGTLETEGSFERIRRTGLEEGDHLDLTPDHRRLDFELLLGAGDLADRPGDGIAFSVHPPGAALRLVSLEVNGEAVPVFRGVGEGAPGVRVGADRPLVIDPADPDLAIAGIHELAAGEPAGGSRAGSGPVATLGVVARSRGEMSDLSDESVRRLRALGYVE